MGVLSTYLIRSHAPRLPGRRPSSAVYHFGIHTHTHARTLTHTHARTHTGIQTLGDASSADEAVGNLEALTVTHVDTWLAARERDA